MEFIDVAWRHHKVEDPVRLVSELNSGRYETRKLEFFPDGRVGFASSEASSNNTELGVVPVPSVEEINSDPQFHASNIERQEFEALWLQYAKNT
jgi:hypothetical protein